MPVFAFQACRSGAPQVILQVLAVAGAPPRPYVRRSSSACARVPSPILCQGRHWGLNACAPTSHQQHIIAHSADGVCAHPQGRTSGALAAHAQGCRRPCRLQDRRGLTAAKPPSWRARSWSPACAATCTRWCCRGTTAYLAQRSGRRASPGLAHTTYAHVTGQTQAAGA